MRDVYPSAKNEILGGEKSLSMKKELGI